MHDEDFCLVFFCTFDGTLHNLLPIVRLHPPENEISRIPREAVARSIATNPILRRGSRKRQGGDGRFGDVDWVILFAMQCLHSDLQAHVLCIFSIYYA